MESGQINDGNKLNIQKGVICFYAYYAVMTITKAIGFDSGDKGYMVLFVLGALLLLYKIVISEYSVNEILFIAASLAAAVLCAVIADEKTIILLVITVAGLKHCDFLETVKVAFSVRVVICSIMVLLSLAEIFNPGIDGTMTSSFQWIMVYDFGYSTPNNAFINIFITIVMYIYINYDKINFKHVIVMGIAVLLFFKMTNSRTGTFLFFILIFLIFVDKFLLNRNMRKAIALCYVFSNMFFAIFSWVATISFQSGGSYFWEFTNRIFSGRLNITNKYYNALSLSFFPRDKEIMQSFRGFGFIDNMYMNVLLNDGILVCILLILIMTWANYKLYKANCYKELIFIAVFSLYAVLEEFPLNPIVNPFVMLIVVLLYKEFTIGNSKIPRLKRLMVWKKKNTTF